MQTSTGQRRRMQRIGALEFTLKGQPLKLTAFAEATDTELRRLFVPFHDLTNGTDTYPGGRYLDLDRTATGVYDLDFNRAYHPFCLFNATYDCPVPPRENRLAMPVRAGEQLGAPIDLGDRLRLRWRAGRLRAAASARVPGSARARSACRFRVRGTTRAIWATTIAASSRP